MAKKRKTPEREEDSGGSTAQLLASFNTSGGTKPRTTTVTVPLDNVLVQESATEYKSLIENCSNSLGVLSHLVSVYLNTKAASDPSYQYLLSPTYTAQLFTRFARLPFDARTNIIGDTFLDAYLQQNEIPPGLLHNIQKGFLNRPRDALSKSMAEMARRHVLEGFEERVKEHIACDVERMMWDRRDDQRFDANVKSAAHCIFQSSLMKVCTSPCEIVRTSNRTSSRLTNFRSFSAPAGRGGGEPEAGRVLDAGTTGGAPRRLETTASRPRREIPQRARLLPRRHSEFRRRRDAHARAGR
jgi:hypothetical protein